MTTVTRVLLRIKSGDAAAAEQLFTLVYEELRRLATAKLAQEQRGQTLQATALVHEAYIRLVDAERSQQWDSRGHFFAAAAEAMRRILVDRARQHRSLKRGGDRKREVLDEAALVLPRSSDELLALDEALSRLEVVDPRAARLVTLRYFAGLTIPEAAESLGVAPRTAVDIWAYARAWLFRALRPAGE